MTHRKENGQFLRGKSGNPNGRPTSETTAIRAQLAQNHKEIIGVVQKAALGGDMQACKMVLDRICPPLKPQAAPMVINLPSEGDITQIAETFIRATADGCLSPDIAAQIVSAVGQLARIVEVTELKNRLEALEHSYQRRKK
ncbi:MAG: hypothetical protein JSS07_09695 [Proteobacteria bacterium]|nr:hypothetical protein [Pseudomonadota bacterium]